MNKETLIGLKSRLSSLQILIEKYERKAEKAYSATAEKRYLGLVSLYSGICSEIRKKIAEMESEAIAADCTL